MWHWAGIIWLAGAISIPCYLLISACRLGWKIRRQRPVTQGPVLDLLEDCKQAMGVRTPLTLLETQVVQCPALLGFVRPRLLLPKGLLETFSLPELRYVFLHELAHLKRGDIPVNWLSIAPLVLHWFNPFVWFAFRQMRADAELACDALALSRMQSGEMHSYGRTVLKVLENLTRPATPFNAAFSAAILSAASELSTAYITASGRFDAREIAMQPLPVPMSAIALPTVSPRMAMPSSMA